ncbi:ATP-binding protein [Hugenholtzia roseola]|uniref:ATP-binding protein n=1 Tax=Hugenholtzia roseola TaxID=1002 RepID=UPI000479DB52|nr:ATP-binding protein [Hugenholtzia roseola]
MTPNWLLFLLSFGYLGLLFAVAYFAERKSKKGLLLTNNAYTYALSLAVYCTAWTFFGSVGQASEQGWGYLSTYLGPILTIPFWGLVLKKIIRICKVKQITTIADFVSARYGRSIILGRMVTLLCVFGVVPYISIQIKAISQSIAVFNQHLVYSSFHTTAVPHFWQDIGFYVTVGLSIFTIIFTTHNIQNSNKNRGMVFAIAFESLIKLLAFLIVGIFVCFFLFEDLSTCFNFIWQDSENRALLTMEKKSSHSFFWHTLSAMLAFLLLPRQFQVSVVENENESHLKRAAWLFPLYLIAINLFVMPIALAGKTWLSSQIPLFATWKWDTDTFVLLLPLQAGANSIAIIAYLGGFAAATSMIIVETAALGTMMGNTFLTPNLAHEAWRNSEDAFRRVKWFRRVMIVGVLLMAYLYYHFVSGYASLVAIGQISFAAVAQLVTVVLVGIFWKNANAKGAIAGLSAGFFLWAYTLVLPSFAKSNLLAVEWLENGLFGISWLCPTALFGLNGLDEISHGVFWSLFFNFLLYVLVSLLSQQSATERNQAEIFVDIFKYSRSYENAVVWKGKAYVNDLKVLLKNFLGEYRTEKILADYFKKDNPAALQEATNLSAPSPFADTAFITFTEKTLTGLIGAASARLVVSSVIQEKEAIDMREVMSILKESQLLLSTNRELRKKTYQLRETSKQLAQANQKLNEHNRTKDDFISTVTHELRTPLTAIRSLAEIVYENPDLPEEQRQEFMKNIVVECERLSKLINEILDIESFEAGKVKIERQNFFLETVLDEVLAVFRPQIEQRKILLKVQIQKGLQVWIDEELFKQAFLNLFSNALKYTHPERGIIAIEAFEDETQVYLTVRDNGRGISIENQEVIFEKFYQLRINGKKPQGTGLGLSIVRKIVEAHEGKIWVESEVGKGAKFVVILPKQKS